MVNATHVPKSAILKIASRCNIACTYCYWFRDGSVYSQPKLLSRALEAQFLIRLAEHIAHHHLPRFSLLFHGGEPLLFGKGRFAALCEKLQALATRLGCEIPLAITTNAMLIDADWVDLIKTYSIKVTISVDGPAAINDRRRIDFKDQGTFSRVMAGWRALVSQGVVPGILAVCDPSADPTQLLEFFYDELNVSGFDVLPPDHTFDDTVESILPFYRALFDVWYERYAPEGRDLRFFDNVIRGLLGGSSHIETIGLGEVTSMTIMTNGDIESLDVAIVTGTQARPKKFNINDDPLSSIVADPVWRELRDASVDLHEKCQRCAFRTPCGGGHIVTRWSASRRFDNPSVYCTDYLALLTYIQARISADLYVDSAGHPEVPRIVDHV